MQEYFMRTLLSEGVLRYSTLEKTNEGLRSRDIVREGPTGALVTTTRNKLHEGNETRHISVKVNDSPEQSRRILEATATNGENDAAPFNDDPWRALRTWLTHGNHRVTILFALELAKGTSVADSV
jgi:hypothetical protein